MLFFRLLILLCCALLPVPSVWAQVADGPLRPGAFRWADDDVADGPLYLIISLARQRVHVYRGDRLIGAASVSTGTKNKATPTGSFPILQKRQWHRSNLYSNAPMPFMQRLTWDGIALHAGHNPGYPASHGCIRLPYAFAQKLFALTQIGTLTEVTTDRLSAALMLDPLVLGDVGSSVVTFGMGGRRQARRGGGVRAESGDRSGHFSGFGGGGDGPGARSAIFAKSCEVHTVAGRGFVRGTDGWRELRNRRIFAKCRTACLGAREGCGADGEKEPGEHGIGWGM